MKLQLWVTALDPSRGDDAAFSGALADALLDCTSPGELRVVELSPKAGFRANSWLSRLPKIANLALFGAELLAKLVEQRPDWIFCENAEFAELAQELRRLIPVRYAVRVPEVEPWLLEPGAALDALRQADLLLVVEESHREKLAKAWSLPVQRFFVLPRFYVIEERSEGEPPLSAELLALTEKLRQEGKYLLVSRVDDFNLLAAKRLEQLFRAFAEHRQNTTDSKLAWLIFGDGSEKVSLSASAHQLSLPIRIMAGLGESTWPSLYRTVDLSLLLDGINQGHDETRKSLCAGCPVLNHSAADEEDLVSFWKRVEARFLADKSAGAEELTAIASWQAKQYVERLEAMLDEMISRLNH